MKVTNVFIASSSEMRRERLELVDLLMELSSDTTEYIPVGYFSDNHPGISAITTHLS